MLPSANPQHLGAVDPQAEQFLRAMWFELPADSRFFVQFWEAKPRLAEPLAALQWHSWGSGQPEPQPAATSPLAHGNKPVSRAWVFVWMCPIGARLRGSCPPLHPVAHRQGRICPSRASPHPHCMLVQTGGQTAAGSVLWWELGCVLSAVLG